MRALGVEHRPAPQGPAIAGTAVPAGGDAAPASKRRTRKIILYGALFFVIFVATNGFGGGDISAQGVGGGRLLLIGLVLWFAGRKIHRMWKARSST